MIPLSACLDRGRRRLRHEVSRGGEEQGRVAKKGLFSRQWIHGEDDAAHGWYQARGSRDAAAAGGAVPDGDELQRIAAVSGVAHMQALTAASPQYKPRHTPIPSAHYCALPHCTTTETCATHMKALQSGVASPVKPATTIAASTTRARFSVCISPPASPHYSIGRLRNPWWKKNTYPGAASCSRSIWLGLPPAGLPLC